MTFSLLPSDHNLEKKTFKGKNTEILVQIYSFFFNSTRKKPKFGFLSFKNSVDHQHKLRFLHFVAHLVNYRRVSTSGESPALKRFLHERFPPQSCRSDFGPQLLEMAIPLILTQVTPGNSEPFSALLSAYYSVPAGLVATGAVILGSVWYYRRNGQNSRTHKLLQRARSSPGELPLQRPIVMGGEELFRGLVKASRLPREVSKSCRSPESLLHVWCF